MSAAARRRSRSLRLPRRLGLPRRLLLRVHVHRRNLRGRRRRGWHRRGSRDDGGGGGGVWYRRGCGRGRGRWCGSGGGVKGLEREAAVRRGHEPQARLPGLAHLLVVLQVIHEAGYDVLEQLLRLTLSARLLTLPLTLTLTLTLTLSLPLSARLLPLPLPLLHEPLQHLKHLGRCVVHRSLPLRTRSRRALAGTVNGKVDLPAVHGDALAGPLTGLRLRLTLGGLTLGLRTLTRLTLGLSLSLGLGLGLGLSLGLSLGLGLGLGLSLSIRALLSLAPAAEDVA